MHHRRLHPALYGFVLVGTSILSLTSNGAAAPVAAADDAAQSAYKGDHWSEGDNGGAGFQAWKLVSVGASGTQGFFIGDSKKAGGADINSAGDKAFGLFGQGDGNAAEAYRAFAAPLKEGQSFSAQLAVNYRNGQKGFDLRDADGNTIFNLNVGGDDYVVNMAASGNGSISSEFQANTVFMLTFVQKSSGGSWSIVRSGGASSTTTGTYAGTAAGIKLYVTGAEAGSENDLMVNHLSIIKAGEQH